MNRSAIQEGHLSFDGGAYHRIERISQSPCTLACPAGINVKAYVSLIAEERFAEALAVVRENCPLPGVCGRVCNHPCEAVCRRSTADGSVSIRFLKRFIADLELELPPPPPLPKAWRKEEVAVIGAGPAGLTATYDLTRRGYRVRLIEGESDLGGMLRYGIPDYRLPREILDWEIGRLIGPTTAVETATVLGKDIGLEDIFEQGSSAIFVAVGASVGKPLGLDGEEEVRGIVDVLTFLKRVNEGDHSAVGERVLVIGGGSSAIDAARTALRLGANSVDIVYRRSREEMPAAEEEIRAAQEEGVGFKYLSAPKELRAESGRLQGITFLEVRLGEPDASGRRRPIPLAGSEFQMRADTVITAIGQETNLPFLGSRYGEAVNDWGYFTSNPDTCSTRLDGIFAGGDVVTGPATVIEAIAAGHKAARAIDRFLREGPESLDEPVHKKVEPWELGLPDLPVQPIDRLHPSETPLDGRKSFEEVELAFTAENAVREASRCMRCGPCSECVTCVSSCSRRHVLIREESGNGSSAIDLLLRTPREGSPTEAREHSVTGMFSLKSTWGEEEEPKPVSVALVKSKVNEKLCRGCGRCVEVCAFHAPKLVPGPAGEPVSRIDAALCRGCGLCVSVCQTGSAEIDPFSKGWITGDRTIEPGKSIVITCQRRGGCITPDPGSEYPNIEVLRLPCAGQIDAGSILHLIRQGAKDVVVAGCARDRCRFESGAGLAHDQIELARSFLKRSGLDPMRIRADWSEDREGDELPWENLVAEGVEL